MLKPKKLFYSIGLAVVLFFFASDPALIAAQMGTQDNYVAASYMQKIKWLDSESLASEVINIANHTSQVLRFDRPIVRVAISDAEICDLILVGAEDILINAKKVGKANLIVWDQDGNIATYGLQSTLDVERLEKILKRIDSRADIKIVPFNNTVSVYGTSETSLKLKQIQDAVKAFDDKSLNYISIRDPKQVLLEVRFAEITRSATDQFKFDLATIGKFGPAGIKSGGLGTATASASYDPGRTAPQPPKLPEWPVTWSSSVTSGASDVLWSYYTKQYIIQPYLKWLEEKGLLNIIARPNLIAKEGEEADFRVGGEYPIPVGQQNGVITIEFKEYGTNMKFMPEILEGNIVRLKLRAEVSQIDQSSAVTSGGVSVPGITKRTQSTVVEMREKETLVIGGILTQALNRTRTKTPFFSDLPVVGRLFTADYIKQTDVELLIVITPYIVQAMDLGEAKKEFYNPKAVKDSTRIFTSPYSNETGDAIDSLVLRKGESRTGTSTGDWKSWLTEKKPASEFADSVAARYESDEGSERSWGWKNHNASTKRRPAITSLQQVPPSGTAT